MPPPKSFEVTCTECGAVFEHVPERHYRSIPQHQRLIVLCRLVYHNWPERLYDTFKPKSEDHMRYWLISQCEGYFDVLKTIRVKTTKPELAFALLNMQLEDSNATNIFMELDDDQIIRRRPRSIAFDEMDHYEATKLFAMIDEVLHRYDMNAEQLLEEARKATQ